MTVFFDRVWFVMAVVTLIYLFACLVAALFCLYDYFIVPRSLPREEPLLSFADTSPSHYGPGQPLAWLHALFQLAGYRHTTNTPPLFALFHRIALVCHMGTLMVFGVAAIRETHLLYPAGNQSWLMAQYFAMVLTPPSIILPSFWCASWTRLVPRVTVLSMRLPSRNWLRYLILIPVLAVALLTGIFHAFDRVGDVFHQTTPFSAKLLLGLLPVVSMILVVPSLALYVVALAILRFHADFLHSLIETKPAGSEIQQPYWVLYDLLLEWRMPLSTLVGFQCLCYTVSTVALIFNAIFITFQAISVFTVVGCLGLLLVLLLNAARLTSHLESLGATLALHCVDISDRQEWKDVSSLVTHFNVCMREFGIWGISISYGTVLKFLSILVTLVSVSQRIFISDT